MKFPPGHRRGIDATGGQLLVEQMARVAAAHGARTLLDHRVVHVVRNDEDEVVGVEARTGRRTVVIGARRGVVFASGGFLHDRQLRTEYLRGHLFGGAASDSSTGDFVRIGLEVGAQLGNMSEAWWDEVALEMALRTPSTIEDVWCPFGDSMIVVNRFGLRVMNEKLPYSERGPVHFNWDATRREYPNLLLFMVYDDAVSTSDAVTPVRYPVPRSGEPHDHVLSGETLDALADKIRSRLGELAPQIGGFQLDESFADGLRASVQRFNEHAALGVDPDHHRGETPIEQKWAPEPRAGAASAVVHPFSESGPYHCIILAAGALDTKGGPKIDDRARVLGVDGDPIVGLYGAGNCIASPAGHAYWGPGGTIGPAVTFGYLAGVAVAAEREHAAPSASDASDASEVWA
jgi:succinate dehydrogenase/fumarate reductase flavoprotein subunit